MEQDKVFRLENRIRPANYPLRCFQWWGRRSATCLWGWVGMRASASASHVCGLTSDFVQFLDADDVLDHNKIEAQVQQVIGKHVRVDLVVGGLRESASRDDPSVIAPGQTLPILDLARSALGRTSSNLFRRESVVAVGSWNVAWKSSQEYELMFRILSNGGNVVYSPDALTWVRKREGSLTENEDVSRFERMVALRADILRFAQRSGKYDGFVIAQLEQTLFGVIRMLGFRSLDAAAVAHSRHIPKGFHPDPSRFNKLYVQTYRLFGFTIAERVRGLMNSLLRRS